MNYFGWLFLALAVAAAGFWLRRRSTLWSQVLIAAGCLGCAGLLVAQVYVSLFRTSVRATDRYHAAAAYFLAHELLRELPAAEGQVCLILPPETAANREALDALFNSFARVLSPLPFLQPKDAYLKTKPRLVDQGRVPRPDFEAALAEVPNALAYVSFAGVPAEADRLSLFSRTNLPPFYVFDPTGGAAWLAPLKKGLIRRVVVPRPEFQAAGSKGVVGPPDEVFKKCFLLITPESAAEMPDPAKGK